jgi:hypothetical protein
MTPIRPVASNRDPLQAPAAPWILRPFAWGNRVGLPPLAIGLVLALAWFGFFLAYTAVFSDEIGRFAKARGSGWALEIVWALLIGMAPAVMAAALRGAVRDARDLAPALGATADTLPELEREVTSAPRWLLRAAGLGALLVTFAVMAPDPRYWVDRTLPSPEDPAYLWLVGRNMVTWWLIARALAMELAVARTFSTLGQRLRSTDLLDVAPLAPFGRHGLRSVLLWMLLVSLFAPFYLLGEAEPVLGVSLVLVLALAGVAFLVPVWGARRHLRATKADEIARVRQAIRAHRDQRLTTPATDPRDGRLADLLAWEGRIADASEWPFGRTTLLRLALYVAIGLGSWLGAATVERALAWLLG